jgi:hypothetical protein
MSRVLNALGALLMVLMVVACGGGNSSLQAVAANQQGKKIAVVSISANNFNNSLQGWNSAHSSDLMGQQVNAMLTYAEGEFGKRFTLVKASEFVGKPEFQKLAGPPREVGLAKIGDQNLKLLANDRDQLIKAALPPEKAKAVVAATGADLVVLIYSEWGVKTGGFIPTSKALTKNVVSIYDASGAQIYNARRDMVGEKTLGAMGSVAVNQETIVQWVASYEKAMGELLAK